MRAGKKKRGSGGNEFLPTRSVWGGKRLRHSAVSRISKQKNFLFLLKEKRVREKIKKCRENFSVLLSRLVGWAETLGRIQSAKSSRFCSKKVRISSNKHHQI